MIEFTYLLFVICFWSVKDKPLQKPDRVEEVLTCHEQLKNSCLDLGGDEVYLYNYVSSQLRGISTLLFPDEDLT
jgi:hypothetical protein